MSLLDIKEDVFTTPNGVDIRAKYRDGTNDRDTLTAIIVHDCYHLADFPISTCAVDLGAHIGAATLAFCSLGLRVAAVEAVPENYGLLCENIRMNGFEGQVNAVHGAVSDTDNEEIMVQYGDTTTESGVVHQFMGNVLHTPRENGQHVMIKTVSLPTLMGPWVGCIVKSDCEGSEWRAFKGLSAEVLNRIDMITAEIHNGSKEDFTAMLTVPFDDVSAEFGMADYHAVLRRVQV